MALEAGTKLGPYEILSPIGAGGMVGAKGRTPLRDVQLQPHRQRLRRLPGVRHTVRAHGRRRTPQGRIEQFFSYPSSFLSVLSVSLW